MLILRSQGIPKYDSMRDRVAEQSDNGVLSVTLMSMMMHIFRAEKCRRIWM